MDIKHQPEAAWSRWQISLFDIHRKNDFTLNQSNEYVTRDT